MTQTAKPGKASGVKKGPTIKIAQPEDGGFNLRHITAIAAVCFAVGLGWPSLMGIDLTPKVQQKTKRSRPKQKPQAPKLAPAPVASKAEPQVPLFTENESTRLDKVVVVSCGASEEEMGARCDQPDLREAMQEPLARLARCPAAEGAAGMLSLGVHVDFHRGHVIGVKAGKSTTLASNVADRIIACAKTQVIGTPASPVPHEHEHYWIYFLTEFLPPGSLIPKEEREPSVIPMSGTATIGFETARVRAEPDHDSPVQARLLYGTRVQVRGRLGEWYKVDYGKPEPGWVHAQTLGL